MQQIIENEVENLENNWTFTHVMSVSVIQPESFSFYDVEKKNFYHFHVNIEWYDKGVAANLFSFFYDFPFWNQNDKKILNKTEM